MSRGKIIFVVVNCVILILINSIQAENILAKPDIKWRTSVANGAEASARKLDSGSWELVRRNDKGSVVFLNETKILVKPGKRYEAAVYFESLAPEAAAHIMLSFNGSRKPYPRGEAVSYPGKFGASSLKIKTNADESLMTIYLVMDSPGKVRIDRVELSELPEIAATVSEGNNWLPKGIFDPNATVEELDWRFSSMESKRSTRGKIDEKVMIRNHSSLRQEHDDDSSLSLWLPKNPLTPKTGTTFDTAAEYAVSFLFRTSAESSGSGGVGIMLTFNNAEGRVIEHKWTELQKSNGSWKKYETTFKTPADTCSVLLRIAQKNMKGTSWFSTPQMDMKSTTNKPTGWDTLKAGKTQADKAAEPYWNWEDYSLDAKGVPPGFISKSANRGQCRIETANTRTQGKFAIVLEGSEKASCELPVVDCSRWGKYQFDFWAQASDNSVVPLVMLTKTDFYGKISKVLSEKFKVNGQAGEWIKYSCSFEIDFMDAFTRICLGMASSNGTLKITEADCQLITPVPLIDYQISKTKDKQWLAEWVSPTSIKGIPSKEIPSQIYYFYRKKFILEEKPERMFLQAAGDDRVEIFVNGKSAGMTKAYNESFCADITEFVQAGENVIGAKVFNDSGYCAVLVECDALYAGGEIKKILSEPSWKSSLKETSGWLDRTFDDSQWESCVAIGKPPVVPWGLIKFQDNSRIVETMLLKKIGVPTAIVAGNELKLALTVEPVSAPLTSMTCSLAINKTEFMKQRYTLPAKGGEVNMTFKIPDYFLPGIYELRIYPETGSVKLATGCKLPSIEIKRRQDKVDFPVVALKRDKGSLVATVNGKPLSLAQYWMMPGLNEFGLKEFGKSGISVFQLDTGIGWEGEGVFDYTKIDQDIVRTLLGADDSMIVLEFPLDTTLYNQWWADKNPDELCADADGNTLLPYYHSNKKQNPSWQSQKYREEFGDALRKFIRHLRQAPYADRIVMLKPCSGVVYEWWQWGCQTNLCVDYSAPATASFQTFMRSLCKNDVGTLKTRWKDESAAFEKIQVPPPSERTEQAKNFFRDPLKEQRMIDYHLFHDYSAGFNPLEHFCKIIKEESEWKMLVGAYNSYNYLAAGFLAHNCSQLNMLKVARSPYIDALYAPVDGYHTERSPGGTGGFLTAPSSCSLWNKFLFQEADNRTFWDFQKLRNGVNLSEDINIFRRELCLNIAFDCEVEYLDFNRNFQCGDPRLTTEFGRLKRIRDFSRQISVKPVRQVAVFADDAALPLVPYPKDDNRQIYIEAGFMRDNKFDFLRSGVKCDYFVLSDLENKEFSTDYKVYFFLNTWRITDAQRKLIESKCKRPGNVLVFFYGNGYFMDYDQPPSAANIENLTGISLKAEPDEITFLSKAIGEDGLASSIAREAGVNRKMAPHFVVNDREAIPLRSYKDDEKKISMAVKKVGGWTSIYSALPGFGPDFIRACARLANCHIYNESNDAAYITGNFVGMHTQTGGRKAIKLPRETSVYDIFAGKLISRKTDRIEWEAKEKTTYLFFLGDSQEAETYFQNKGF